MKNILTALILALILPGGLFIIIGLIIRHRRQKLPKHLAHLGSNKLHPKDIEPGTL